MTLFSAKDKPLFTSGNLPIMSDALLDWFQSMTFGIVQKQINDFQLQEIVSEYTILAVKQPFGPQKLEMVPAHQRAWKWETLHTVPNCILIPDDIVWINSVKYRVIEKLDYTEYGFLEYHIVTDYDSEMTR